MRPLARLAAASLAGTLASASASPLAASPAAAIEGRYRIEGTNPGNAAAYKGEALIKKAGASYSIVWQTGGTQQVGTGLLSGDVLAIAFRGVGSTQAGVASFRVENGRVTGGEWTMIGAQVNGTERWTAE